MTSKLDFERVATPPDAAVGEMHEAGMKLMGQGRTSSPFTAIVVIGTYEVGCSAHNHRKGVTGGVFFRHPDYPAHVELIITRLRQMADDMEAQSEAAKAAARQHHPAGSN